MSILPRISPFFSRGSEDLGGHRELLSKLSQRKELWAGVRPPRGVNHGEHPPGPPGQACKSSHLVAGPALRRPVGAKLIGLMHKPGCPSLPLPWDPNLRPSRYIKSYGQCVQGATFLEGTRGTQKSTVVTGPSNTVQCPGSLAGIYQPWTSALEFLGQPPHHPSSGCLPPSSLISRGGYKVALRDRCTDHLPK